MRWQPEKTLALVGCLVVTACILPARAAEHELTHLRFDGLPGCDDARALVHEVERRLSTISWTSPERASTAITVRLARGRNELRSVLLIEQVDRPSVTRVIASGNCQEAIEATALVVAVLLSHERPSSEAFSSAPPDASEAAHAVEHPTTWRFGGGTSAVLMTGIAPGVLPGVEAFLGLGVDREGWAPAFRVTVRHLRRSGFTSDEAQAAFRLTSGVLTSCPGSWFPGGRVALRPCAAISYGSLEASGSDTLAPQTERHPWAGLGGGLRFEARLLRVLSLELEAGLEAALVRSRFRFGGAAFHETSAISSRFGLTLAAHVP